MILGLARTSFEQPRLAGWVFAQHESENEVMVVDLYIIFSVLTYLDSTEPRLIPSKCHCKSGD